MRAEINLKDNKKTRAVIELNGKDKKGNDRTYLGLYYIGADNALYADMSGLGGGKAMIPDINLNQILKDLIAAKIPEIPSIMEIIGGKGSGAASGDVINAGLIEAVQTAMDNGELVVTHYGLAAGDEDSAAVEETASLDIKTYASNQYGSIVLCGGQRRGEILKELLAKSGLNALLSFPLTKLPQPGQILIAGGSLPAGLEYPTLKFAILTEGQIAVRQERRRVRAPKKATNRKKLDSFTDLTPGDLVVHEHHGIGRYVGMEQLKVGGVTKDYVKIAYQGTDCLYVPATQLDLVSKYIGAGEDTPVRLNKLGGDQWQKTKAKAKAAAKDLAAGLIKLYAERKRLPGFAFAADSPWQQEFEESFEYAETDDQLRCIDEIKRDMESPSVMARLLASL